jgi:hypothetical protein
MPDARWNSVRLLALAAEYMSAYVSIRQHTSAYADVKLLALAAEHMSAYVSIRQHTLPAAHWKCVRLPALAAEPRPLTSLAVARAAPAYVSIRQHLVRAQQLRRRLTYANVC